MTDFPLYPETGSHHEPMTAPRAQEPLPCPHWQVSYSATKVDGKAVRSWRCECGQEFSPVSAPSADTRRLDWLDREGAYWGLNRAAIDAAMTQEGE